MSQSSSPNRRRLEKLPSSGVHREDDISLPVEFAKSLVVNVSAVTVPTASNGTVTSYKRYLKQEQRLVERIDIGRDNQLGNRGSTPIFQEMLPNDASNPRNHVAVSRPSRTSYVDREQDYKLPSFRNQSHRSDPDERGIRFSSALPRVPTPRLTFNEHASSNLSSRELRSRRLRQQQEERASEPSSVNVVVPTIDSPNLVTSSTQRSDVLLDSSQHCSNSEQSALHDKQLSSNVQETSTSETVHSFTASSYRTANFSRAIGRRKLDASQRKSILANRRLRSITSSNGHPATTSQGISSDQASLPLQGWSTLSRNRHEPVKFDKRLGNQSTTKTVLNSSSPRNGSKNTHNNDDDDDDDDDDDGESDDDGNTIDEETNKECLNVDCDAGTSDWSVKVSVVSGVDFPPPVIPNVPQSPVIRLGWVSATDQSKCTNAGLLSMSKKARVKSTTPRILAKRDNGSIDFHEEFRWDDIRSPENLFLVVQLDSRAVLMPHTYNECPSLASQSAGTVDGSPHVAKNTNEETAGVTGIESLFRRSNKMNYSELQTANAAAAAAKILVEGSRKDVLMSSPQTGPLLDSNPLNVKSFSSNLNNHYEVNVNLRSRKQRQSKKMTPDLFLGSKVIPLALLALDNVKAKGMTSVRLEQWFELTPEETIHELPKSSCLVKEESIRRNPSILLEISFSSSFACDAVEDEQGEDDSISLSSFTKRESLQVRNQAQAKVQVGETVQVGVEHVLVPGIIDFICVVGARDIGDQKFDDGSSGWVNSNPECCVLEQFPSEAFHITNGRSCVLPNKVEWFCFPEGCRLWRGTTPPNLEELNLKRFSASSSANISNSIASFDACLGCTTSFSWFVISSHADEYGSEGAKTFGAVIRFFVPAPIGIDPTQDDFAQTFVDGPAKESGDVPEGRRLWVPIGICLTSTLPIIGAMEAILLRLCEAFASKGLVVGKSAENSLRLVDNELVNLICVYQRPIPGAVHCSVPFLRGDNFHISMPPPGCMPVLPHGNAIASVCRLLGADGFVHLLAAVLTECKIIIHSSDIANLCLVSEVMLALMYPFSWSLPYIPVLPIDMVEFVEAPLSYFLGIPSCNMKHINPVLLEDIVVVDLDKDLALSGLYDGLMPIVVKSKIPTPLPATVAGNISRAVYRLLKCEERDENVTFSSKLSPSRVFPRLESESIAERDFRISVAIEVCGLIRGYQDCLMYASSCQPIFNMDKFLLNAPSLFEEQRGISSDSSDDFSSLVLSPRSRRFMSLFVNCQHFHQFLEVVDSEKISFFHEVIRTVHTQGGERRLLKRSQHAMTVDSIKSIESLRAFLQKRENTVPVYRVQRLMISNDFDLELASLDQEEAAVGFRFPRDILKPIMTSDELYSTFEISPGCGVKQISVEYLMKLNNNPWRYQLLFNVKLDGVSQSSLNAARVNLRDAIGDRRYLAWKLAIDRENFNGDDSNNLTNDGDGKEMSVIFDSKSIASNERASSDANFEGTISLAQIADDKDLESLRKCLSFIFGDEIEETSRSGSYLVCASSIQFRSPAARLFFLEILRHRSDRATPIDKQHSMSIVGSTKLHTKMFEYLLQLACSFLDSCLDSIDFDSAYALLELTAGVCMISGDNESNAAVIYLTEKIVLHLIFSEPSVWERATILHLQARKDEKIGNSQAMDEDEAEYEAVVATLYEMLGYGVPTEEMARFSYRFSELRGWFNCERGNALMFLAKRLSSRKEQGCSSGLSPLSKVNDMERMKSFYASTATRHACVAESDNCCWIETSWCHPAAQSARRLAVCATSSRTGNQNLFHILDDQKMQPNSKTHNPTQMKRSAITSMAYLGASVFVTGGLDGGVFLARKLSSSTYGDSERSPVSGLDYNAVKGIHLDWGSSGSRYTVASTSGSLDGEYGVGAVSCIAATCHNALSRPSLGQDTSTKDSTDLTDSLSDDELLNVLDGCKVLAGTTCGDFRVWTVKDVYSAVFFYSHDDPSCVDPCNTSDLTKRHTDDILASKFINANRKLSTNLSSGSSLTRLKFSLRGRALSGHRGGVCCIDVPSQVYRPDTVMSGGADGLIKIWNLRSPGALGRRTLDVDANSYRQGKIGDSLTSQTTGVTNGDAICILSGHGGRILCLKSAWHGDRLLSGGADRTVRLWDIAGSGKCLTTMSSHRGWVTHVRYWGSSTIVTASTDRSILLWDTRSRPSPLFSLRHHYAPISDLLVGSRNDPMLFSASNDGYIALWDVRFFSQSCNNPQAAQNDGDTFKSKHSRIRRPSHALSLRDHIDRRIPPCSVFLCRGYRNDRPTVLNTGSDAIIREWDFNQDKFIHNYATGHCDQISSFSSLYNAERFDMDSPSLTKRLNTGFVTTSWDGTVRLRTMVSTARRQFDVADGQSLSY